MAYDHAAFVAEAREPAHDRGIVAERPVAVQFLEPGENAVHVIERVRPLRMARDLRDLPGVELGVDVLGERLALLLQPSDLFGDVERGVVLHEAQLLDPRLQLGDGLLELQEARLHSEKCRLVTAR
jgi:hypothetical protein